MISYAPQSNFPVLSHAETQSLAAAAFAKDTVGKKKAKETDYAPPPQFDFIRTVISFLEWPTKQD